MSKILIIEDDIKLCDTMKMSLEVEGYEVTVVYDFKEVEQLYRTLQPDLTLLDIQLPYLNGFILCKMFRKINTAPIIIISSGNTEDDQILGVELGADEYVVKPFSMGLLKAKIKAILRRSGMQEQDKVVNERYIEVSGLLLDTHKMTMGYKDEQVSLSKNEYILMKTFLQAVNKVIPREELMMAIWDDEHFIDENTLNVNIRRVKNRLEDLGLKDIIQTKRSVGYLLDTERIRA